MLRGIVISADGEYKPVEFSDGNMGYLQLKRALAEAVGEDCYLEMVHPIRVPYVSMVIDESGAVKELPINHLGSALYGGAIHGPIIVFARKELMEWDQTLET